MLNIKTKESNIKTDTDKKDTEKRSESKIFFEPQAREGSESCDNYTYTLCFSVFQYASRRNEEKSVTPIFLDALKKATSRVWLIDTYLSKNLDILEKIIDEIIFNDSDLQVRIFLRETASSSDLSNLIQEKNDFLAESNSKTTIVPGYFTIFERIHDRFALIDNQLWHFGSDVGASSTKLNATSFGWNAEELQVDKFFKELWENGQ